MDPATMASIMAIISNFAASQTGNEGQHGSTYSKGSQSALDDALESVRGMRGNADITQNQGYQQGQEWLNNLFSNDQGFFNAFEAPLQRQFQEQTIPDLANRFASQGSGGSLGSTGFRNQLAREGSNLSTNIAALRGGMQQQGANQQLQYAQQPVSNYQNLLNTAITPTQNTYQPPSAGPYGGIASSTTSAAIQALMNRYGNPGAAPSTQGGYQPTQPLTAGYDSQFRNAGVY